MARTSKIDLTPDQLAQARSRIAHGVSVANAAKDLGVSRMTLQRRLDEAPAPRKPTAPAELTPEAVLALAGAASMSLEDQRAYTSAKIRLCDQQAEQALASGEPDAARKWLDAAAHMNNTLARLNKGALESDMIMIPRAQFEERLAAARAKWRANEKAHGQIVCSRCRCELATQWANDPLAPVVKGGSSE